MARLGLQPVIIQVLFFLVGLGLAGNAKANSLAQIIEGAKKEGTVSIKIRSSLTEHSMIRLQKEIKEKFGVNLKIKFTPSGSMAKEMAQVMMEYKTGARPSYDLVNFSTHAAPGFQAGALERVDWKPLLTPDTNPGVVLTHPVFYGALVYYTSHHGLMYNPQKISSDKVPRTFQQLADPQWKDKVGIPEGSSGWTRKAFVLGKEKIHNALGAILRNGAIQGQFSTLNTRYQMEEIWMAFTLSSYYKNALDKGMPAAWQSLDYAEVALFTVTIPTGALHPNAARLVAVYLASPEGSKFCLEESGSGNLFYAGNYEHDITTQNKKQGIKEYVTMYESEMMDFVSSKDYRKWRNEIGLILKTGGTLKGKKKK